MENDFEYWEKLKHYKENIISVFEEKNELTKFLESIESKQDKRIIDFGCGIGNAMPYLKDFKKVYGVDFSTNMLEMAKENSKGLDNIEFINGNLTKTIIKPPVDIILAVSSVMPKHHFEFDIILQNFLKNIKPNGTIILVLPSFESKLFSYHLHVDTMLKNMVLPEDIIKIIQHNERKENIGSLGNLITDIGLLQKHWLKEEILFRLSKYNFNNTTINKLKLNWSTQIKRENYSHYPNLWFWMVQIVL